MVREAMLAKAPVPPENIHPVPVDGSPDGAARRYEQVLQTAYGGTVLEPNRPLFDVMHLGLGPDGHTASLLPGDPVLEDRSRWVAMLAWPPILIAPSVLSADFARPGGRSTSIL